MTNKLEKVKTSEVINLIPLHTIYPASMFLRQ